MFTQSLLPFLLTASLSAAAAVHPSGSAAAKASGTRSSASPVKEIINEVTPYPVQPGMVQGCNRFYLVQAGDDCNGVVAGADISLSDFYAWNPAVGPTCSYLVKGDYVCLGLKQKPTPKPTSAPAPTSSPATSAAPTSVKPAPNTVSTPSPIQSGMTSNCDQFHRVDWGDRCNNLARDAGISLQDFYAWNPAVGSECSYLVVGDYVCLHTFAPAAQSATPTAEPSTSSASAAGGVATPSPIQSGMVGGCTRFYQVKPNDNCIDVAAAAGVRLADFYAWNPAVGTSCTNLDIGDYVCTHA